MPMPLVTIHLFPGRTASQKKAVVRGVTDVLVREANALPEHVEVILIEVPKEHWAIGGNLPEPATTNAGSPPV